MNKLFFPFSSDKYNLETKWWHRLLKILYFLVSIIILILSFFMNEEWKNNFTNFNNSIFWTSKLNEKDLIQTYLDDTTQNIDNRKNVFQMLKDQLPISDVEDTILTKNSYKPKTKIFPTKSDRFKQDLLFYSEITILTILSYLIINFIIQLFYYKGILYVVYGNREN